MLELQYENVKMSFETRPRNASHKFEIILGALYLHDRLTKDTQFPVLISPQGRDQGAIISRVVSSRVLSPRLSQRSSSSQQNLNISNEPLFEFLYEQKPFNSNSDFR